MKVTLQTEISPPKLPLVYPVLMEGIYKGGCEIKLVVLFCGRNEGMRAYDSEHGPLFEKSQSWINADDETEWKPFTGKLILEN